MHESAPPASAIETPLRRGDETHTETATFTTWDGVELFYRVWRPARPSEKVLVLFHRGHEHSGRFADVVAALGLEDVTVYAWDARGHGHSPGARGDAPSFGGMVRDVDTFIRHLADHHGHDTRDMVVLAHSVGAVAVSAWVHDYAPRLRGLILATPALRVRLYVPLAIPGLRLLQTLRGESKPIFVKSYVKSTMLTHDPAQAAAYDDDPLIAKAISVKILLGLYDAGTRLIEDAGQITTPTLMLAGGSDYVVSVKAQRRFFERLGSEQKKLRVFDAMYHDVLHERDRGLVLDEVRGFLEERFAAPPAEVDLRSADAQGPMHEEFRRLSIPLPAWSPRNLAFRGQDVALRTIGRLSDGIRLGYATGFDSGQSLDYVYEDRAKGRWGVGRLIDRAYLDALGWRGIRQRRVHLQSLLGRAIRLAHERDGRAHILDVATGCGRYVLDTIRQTEVPTVSATLRDFHGENLEQAKQHAADFGLDGIGFEVGDAFDERSLADVAPTPNVAVVSGLYELFPENAPLQRSLRGLATGLAEGGYLLYTGQPWHPQVEMIARILPSHRGKSWVMRRRSQAELDQLVRDAGFEKIDMLIDEWGIFTVSLARKVS